MLLYGFSAIDYRIESAMCCPEIPSFEVAFCRMLILIPEIAKSQFDAIRFLCLESEIFQRSERLILFDRKVFRILEPEVSCLF